MRPPRAAGGESWPVLRTLGFVRRQLGATLAVQATAVTAVALVVGLPIGIAVGRGGWGLVATGLSVVHQPVVPATILLVAPAAMVVANLMAVLPARRAASVRPAEILRAE
ncbi:MAG: ABC transporter permease [Actinobacteria bacterium]|nr:ABC transporter permease [Actinomycetota bacterium]